MNRVKDTDPRQLRRLIQEDGLPYPKRFHESDPKSYDIVNIGQNVENNIEERTEDLENAVGGLANFSSLGDFCFEDHDYSWRPRRYVYRGDTPRTTRRPLRNFLRTVLHIKRFKSDEELEEEERAIREILARYPDRMIKIYSMTSLMNYLAASPGVTVSPNEVIQYLKLREVKRKYKSYRSSRKYFVQKLHEKGMDLNKTLTECEEKSKKVMEIMELISKGTTVEDITRCRKFKSACKTTASYLKNLKMAYWDFKLTNDDCFHFLYDYLMEHILNFCKLNPQRQPKRKVKATAQGI